MAERLQDLQLENSKLVAANRLLSERNRLDTGKRKKGRSSLDLPFPLPAETAADTRPTLTYRFDAKRQAWVPTLAEKASPAEYRAFTQAKYAGEQQEQRLARMQQIERGLIAPAEGELRLASQKVQAYSLQIKSVLLGPEGPLVLIGNGELPAALSVFRRTITSIVDESAQAPWRDCLLFANKLSQSIRLPLTDPLGPLFILQVHSLLTAQSACEAVRLLAHPDEKSEFFEEHSDHYGFLTQLALRPGLDHGLGRGPAELPDLPPPVTV
jgi:hypothetical protein